MPLFQSRHPVEQLHEFSFLCPDQFPADTIGHIEATTVAVFVGNNQVKGLHHQFLVLLQGPGEILIGFHAHQGHNGFPFPGRQCMIQPHGFRGKPGMDYQNVVGFAVAGGGPNCGAQPDVSSGSPECPALLTPAWKPRYQQKAVSSGLSWGYIFVITTDSYLSF